MVRGDGRGRTLGIPTANIATQREAIPRVGVYATWTRFDGDAHASVTNIGLRPTFEGSGVRIETHLLDAPPSTDLYGRHIEVAFVKRLRNEKRFAGAQELLAQIRTDIADARAVLTADPSPRG